MIRRILLILLILLLVPARGIDRMLLRTRWSKWARRLFYVPNIALALLLTYAGVFESYSMQADRWKGVLLAVALCVLVPETLLWLCLLLSRALRKWPRWSRALKYVGVFIAAAAFGSMIYGFTKGFKRITVVRFDYFSADVPPTFDGYRIVQLSDLHFGTLRAHPDVVGRIVDSVLAQQPDLIVLTGDLVNYHPEELEPFADDLKRLQAPDGVLSIMGNHDYLTYYDWHDDYARIAQVSALQDAQRELGWTLLLNANAVVRREADSIVFIGLENDGPPRFPALANLEKARKGLSDSAFQIVLEHDPSYWDRAIADSTALPLTLSGHTHGMQLRLFGWSPAAWFYPRWGGVYCDDGGQTLYVSQGVGQVLLPFRLGAWPEINLITLHSAE